MQRTWRLAVSSDRIVDSRRSGNILPLRIYHADLEWPMIWITVSIWLISKAIPVFSVQIAMAALLQCVLIVFAATVMSYAAATVGRPLIDRELLLADQFIG